MLYAWETSELECVVSGSRPAPEITWLLGTERVTPSFTHTSFNGNVTTSSLAFNARPEHHGLRVACIATNAAFPEDTLEESWNLVVHCELSENNAWSTQLRSNSIKILLCTFHNQLFFTDAPVVDLYPCSRETAQPVSTESGPLNGAPVGYVFMAEKGLCLRCSILANPSPNAIRWSHNGNIIEVNS